jgi:hypothetical protein
MVCNQNSGFVAQQFFRSNEFDLSKENSQRNPHQ